MRLFLLIASCLLLASCNDIDGKLRVFSDFTLTDEDGRQIVIGTGTHEAEVSWDVSESKMELEIDDVDGDDDREFEFRAPDLSNVDLQAERIEMEVFADECEQPVDVRVLITNTVTSKEGPMEGMFRCIGSSVYKYRPVIYFNVEKLVGVAIGMNNGEEQLALFEGVERVKERKEIWSGECGETLPDWSYNPSAGD